MRRSSTARSLLRRNKYARKIAAAKLTTPVRVRCHVPSFSAGPAMADHPTRILLVDDEQSILTLLSFPLSKEGYEVVRAADGYEALERFDETEFDLVVLDVMMPHLDGLEVCRQLRARSTVPIIMLTAKAEEI